MDSDQDVNVPSNDTSRKDSTELSGNKMDHNIGQTHEIDEVVNGTDNISSQLDGHHCKGELETTMEVGELIHVVHEGQTDEIDETVNDKDNTSPQLDEDSLEGEKETTVESLKDDECTESVPQGAAMVEEHDLTEAKTMEQSVISTEKDEISDCTEEARARHDMVNADSDAVPMNEVETGNDDIHDIDPRTQANGLVQILSLLWKNGLTKLRTPVATFFEFFSPLLMMLILAAAYQLSEINYKDAATYASLSIDLPGPWFDLLNPQSLASLTGSFPTSRRSLVELDLQEHLNGEMVDITGSMLSAWLEGSMSRKLMDGHQDHASKIRRLQSSNEDDEPSERENAREAYSYLDDASQQIAELLQSPTVIPSFDSFATVSIAISQAIGVETLPDVFTDSSYGRQWGNLLTLGTIHLSPTNSFSDSFWSYLNRSYPALMETGLVKVRAHQTEGDALQFINANLDERTWALLDFSACSFEEQDFTFKIRMNYTTVPNTNQIVDYVSIGLDSAYQMYYLSGFLTLQRTINEFIFSETDQCTEDLSSIWSMPMPTAAYSQNPFFLAVGSLLGLTIVMAYLYPTSRLVKTMVEEKETKMRETLFILGLRGWAHWMSWFFTGLFVFLIITATVTVSLTATVLRYSDPVYIFAIVGLFSTSTMGLCFTLASLFSRAKLAAIMAPMVLFATILPRFIFFGFNRYEATTGMIITSLFPATAFAFGADIIADYEYAEQGIQSWNASEGDYSFNTALGMLFVDTLIYFFLGFYLDQVIPRQYGRPRPFYFFLLPSFWSGVFGFRLSRTQDSSFDGVRSDDNGSNFETVRDEDFTPKVFIENLLKQYKKRGPASAPAVDHLNLTLYENQITALLGHNGAGKTSTVSVLTGLFPPTSGDCFIYGHSIVQDIQAARHSIGICPQHNVLFDSLTVAEHLRLFMKIKGLKPSAAAVERHASEIGLTDFLNSRSASLSGGNKRKLSVAIALCADPKCLILDEPTSAMDPHSRRAVWELLRSKRKGRVTLLTTHFLDEAEILCDRIAVMKDGKLQCCGSTNFLKERFGLGYNLTVVLEPKARLPHGGNEREIYEPLVFASQLSGVTAVVRNIIPGTEVVRVSGKEVTYRIPRGSEQLLPDLFDTMEAVTQEWGIGAFGVRDSSLEEIFLQLAEDGDDDNGVVETNNSELRTSNVNSGPRSSEETDEEEVKNESESNAPNEISRSLSGFDHDFVSPGQAVSMGDDQASNDAVKDIQDSDVLHHLSPLRQIGLLYWKRFVVQRRDVKGLCFIVIVPLIVISLVLLVLLIEPPYVGSAIELSPTLYNEIGGERSNTSVVIGLESESSVEYDLLSSYLVEQYPFVEVSQLQNATSQKLSDYLLKTYNERISPPRFGAFALDDVVDVLITVDWGNLSTLLDDLNGFNVSNLMPMIDRGGSYVAPALVPLILDLFSMVNSSTTDIPGLSDTVMSQVNNSNVNVSDWLSSISSFLQDAILTNSTMLNDVLPDGTETYILQVPTRASILHNASSPHAVAAFNQAFASHLYRSSCSASNSTVRLASVNEPLPMTQQQSIEVQTILSILAAIFLLIPFGYIPGAFIVFLVKERVSKSKHLQLVSGVNMTSYWLGQYVWDLTLFAVITFGVMMIFLLFGKESAAIFVGDAQSFFATMIVIFGYGCSVLPFSYLFARKFDNPESAQISVIGVLFITGFVAVNAYYIMDSIDSTKDVAAALQPLFRMWPGYLLGDSFIQLASAFWEREILFGERNPFDWDVTGKLITLLYSLAIVYFLLLLMLEYSGDGGSGGLLGRVVRCIWGSFDRLLLSRHGVKSVDGQISIVYDDAHCTSSDEDVLAEEEYVKSTPLLETSAPVVMKDLWKVFPPPAGCSRKRRPRLAVRGLSAAIHKGETFGLLGSNGAGKSTTLAMLTSDIAPTAGEAYVANSDITGRIPGGVAKARQSIGLCPQTDPLLDLMTGRETLKMFASLRGVRADRLDGVVSDLIEKLTLTPHADKVTESYSGGNKRKLSLGIAALVGDGGVLMVDECSTGLDPMARRKLWELIEDLAVKRSVVITTHSMEEAEALCSRVGIMSHGRFVALGTVQHLKSKFLDGYNVEINCKPNTPELVVDELISELLTETLPGSTVAERHGRFVTLDVPRISSIGLGVSFKRLQALKERVDSPVENYSMSQCSLEQVFIKLVKDANEIEFGSGRSEETVVNPNEQMA